MVRYLPLNNKKPGHSSRIVPGFSYSLVLFLSLQSDHKKVHQTHRLCIHPAQLLHDLVDPNILFLFHGVPRKILTPIFGEIYRRFPPDIAV